MANVKISQLPSLSTMTDLAQIPVVAGGTTYQITGSNLSSYFSTSAAGSKIVNGSTEANIGASGGNANISVGGISNVAVFTQSGVIVSGVLTAPVLTTNNIRSDDSSFVNIEDGVNITGAVIAAGNVVGNYFIGNGSQLTGLAATYGNANVVANLAALGTNPVSTTGNITGGYIFGNGSQLTGITGNLDITGTTIEIAAGASETVLEIRPDNSPGWAYLKLPNDATSNTVDTQLNNDNGNVSIGTGGDQFGVFPTWLFDNTGNLTLPEGGSLFSQSSTPSGSPGNTIVLQPAGSGITTGQKLMIYPTAGDGDHIHLTSGNLYQTELFLGSDNFYVKLANTGDIVVQTDGGVGLTAQWTFGSGGTLTAPGQITVPSLITNSIRSDDSSFVNIEDGLNITGAVVASGNITGNYFIGNGSQLTGINNSFAGEMHVSKNGNDSTGTGNILQPYLTITHALTQVAGGRNTIVIHPGAYTENPTITSLATQLITYDATGASTLVDGTVTIANVTGRIAGLKMTNLAITGNAQAYINSSTVDGQFTKSSSGYVEVDDCELQATGNVLISGSGIITITGNKIANLVVNNAGASVLVKGADDCLMPQVTAGTLNIVDSIIRASSNTANAVTASAGTVVTLMNNQIVTPAADNVARVSIAGFHSIISLVYDKANSTLSNSLNSVVYFQTANVDSLVSSGNITGGNLLTGGLISATGNVSGGNLNVTGNIVDTGALSIITGSNGNIALAPNGTGNVTVSSNISITGNTATITSSNLQIGYLEIPQISFAANATAALVDSGKHYYSTSTSNLALTLADNSAVSWPVGTALSIVNRGTANITVAPAAGVSLYLAGNATSGNRTVTTYGMATVMNVAANIWMISGTVV